MQAVLEKFLVKAVVSIQMAQDVVAIGWVQLVSAIAVAQKIAVAQNLLKRLPLQMGYRKQGRT